MKKIISLLLVVLLLLSLAGCTNSQVNQTNKNQVYIIDLEQCEIGYEVPVYPDCDFKFITDNGEIVEISSFKVILKEKNSVSINKTIDRDFMKNRYVLTVVFNGKTDPNLAGKRIDFYHLVSASGSYDDVYTDTIVENDGTFKFEGKCPIDRYITGFIFGDIDFR